MENLRQQLDELVTKMCKVQTDIDMKAVELGVFKEFKELDEMSLLIAKLYNIVKDIQ